LKNERRMLKRRTVSIERPPFIFFNNPSTASHPKKN
jgi:hypothetical protein